MSAVLRRDGKAAVYTGPVRAAIIGASGGTDLVLWAPGLSGSGPRQRLHELSVQSAHSHNSAAEVQTPQLSPGETLPPGFHTLFTALGALKKLETESWMNEKSSSLVLSCAEVEESSPSWKHIVAVTFSLSGNFLPKLEQLCLFP